MNIFKIAILFKLLILKKKIPQNSIKKNRIDFQFWTVYSR